MGLFGDYESSGAGIAKNAPKKKPFFRFWELVFRKFWKLINVNLLLMSSLLPILGGALSITYLAEQNIGLCFSLLAVCLVAFVLMFGPVIAGCTQILRYFSMEKPVFLWDMFCRTIRKNFRKSFLMGFLDILIGGSMVTSFIAYPQAAANTGNAFFYVLLVLTLSVGLAVLMMSFYAYPMIVSTELDMVNILKNSFALTILALKTNLLTLLGCLLTAAVFAVLTILMPMVMFAVLVFMPVGFIAFGIVFNCYPVIQKYVINPYYAQKGEVSPEMSYADTEGENVFEDQGGKETPVAPKKKKKGKKIS